MMLDELERRNFTDSTRRAYFRIIEDFARHFNRPPDQLGPAHIREYTAHLFRDRKLSDSSVHQTVGALRFFFVKMLKRPWRVEETPYPKRRTRLPVILSREEVARLIESASNPFHRTILMTLYATGVRRAELARLKLTDIDTERMVLHIRNGKGRKDRDVVLSPHLLTELRQHYRRLASSCADSCCTCCRRDSSAFATSGFWRIAVAALRFRSACNCLPNRAGFLPNPEPNEKPVRLHGLFGLVLIAVGQWCSSNDSATSSSDCDPHQLRSPINRDMIFLITIPALLSSPTRHVCRGTYRKAVRLRRSLQPTPLATFATGRFSYSPRFYLLTTIQNP